jgi:NAD(P)-dependent dehydrogenase (short-subunit alcohol dehydrogenase family)
MQFDGKVVLVTGGGTGIGKAVASRFYAAGAQVVLGGRRAEVLASAAREIDPSGTRVVTVPGDIADPATARQLVGVATERFGGVDILINNAGIFKPTPFLDHSEDDLNRYLDVILKGTFFASQAAIPAMRRRGGGVIINVGSMWALQAINATPSSAYSAAKAGVHALTHNLALEFAGDNIRVNTVAPAVVETPVYTTFLSQEQADALLPTFNAFHPLGRNGQPDDVASAIMYLADDSAGWVTGVVLPVDGGVTAGRHA